MASGTGFARRYHEDPFFKTEISIIAFHTLFASVIVVAVMTSYLNTSYYIGDTTTLNDATGTNAVVNALIAASFEELQYRRTRNFTILIVIIVTATLAMGYVIAQISLRPTRNALSMQKQFIGNIAHELRTPLSTIKTNTEVALFDTSLDPPLRETLMHNLLELDRISDIINNLLSLDASLRPERVSLEIVDLADVVTSVMDSVRPLYERKNISITSNVAEKRTVYGNTAALEQIVTNILKNAITYTPQNGRITISIEPAMLNMLDLVIEDNGTGIAPNDLTHIFEPFFRSDRARSRALGGSGLGLAIVHELVKLQHGKIVVKSILGRGTTVVVRLPTMPPESGSAAQPLASSREIVVDYSREERL